MTSRKSGKSAESGAQDPILTVAGAALAMGEAVLVAEAQIIAEAMTLAGRVASPAKPETEAERARHEAEVEEGFDNMPV